MNETVNKNIGHATAYGYAKSKGYTGTEEQFAELMASYADVGQTAVDAALAAKASEDAAKASETASATSATEAEGFATNASTSAGNASQAAQSASQSATAAAGSATSAGQSATAAAGSATTAGNKATEAAQSATAAAGSATTAGASATAAQTAQTAAETAQAAAEAAAQTLVIDPTLTQPNQAADAKATGDAISLVKSHLEDLDNEVYYPSTLGLSDLTWTQNTGLKYEDGTTTSRNNFITSEYIDVVEDEEIVYTLTGQNNLIAVIAAYDASGVYKRLDSVGYDSQTATSVVHTFSGTYVVPTGVSKIRIGRWLTTGSENDAISIPTKIGIPKQNRQDIAELRSDVSEIEEEIALLGIGDAWKDKTISAFGTSLTDTGNSPNAVDPNGNPTGKYLPYLIDLGKFGALNPLPTVSGIELDHTKSTNYGLAGAAINGQILYRIDYYLHDVASHKRGDYADLIIIEGGVNDYAIGVPLGNVGDTTPYTSQYFDYGTNDGTFAGACYQAFTRALTYAPGAVVVYITDSTGKAYSNGNNYNQLRKNGIGLYQRDYADMAMEVAKFVGIPVIDAGADSMINAQNPDYIVDWIHHTYLGGYQYARTIWSILQGIPTKALTVPN